MTEKKETKVEKPKEVKPKKLTRKEIADYEKGIKVAKDDIKYFNEERKKLLKHRDVVKELYDIQVEKCDVLKPKFVYETNPRWRDLFAQKLQYEYDRSLQAIDLEVEKIRTEIKDLEENIKQVQAKIR
jgi:hypothetical protein